MSISWLVSPFPLFIYFHPLASSIIIFIISLHKFWEERRIFTWVSPVAVIITIIFSIIMFRHHLIPNKKRRRKMTIMMICHQHPHFDPPFLPSVVPVPLIISNSFNWLLSLFISIPQKNLTKSWKGLMLSLLFQLWLCNRRWQKGWRRWWWRLWSDRRNERSAAKKRWIRSGFFTLNKTWSKYSSCHIMIFQAVVHYHQSHTSYSSSTWWWWRRYTMIQLLVIISMIFLFLIFFCLTFLWCIC